MARQQKHLSKTNVEITYWKGSKIGSFRTRFLVQCQKPNQRTAHVSISSCRAARGQIYRLKRNGISILTYGLLRKHNCKVMRQHKGADGHGIYLVFWFGSEYKQTPPVPKTQEKPDTAMKMEAILYDRLPEVLRLRTEVIVFNVSRQPEK